jgi:uroporphyrinogen-III synthase
MNRGMEYLENQRVILLREVTQAKSLMQLLHKYGAHPVSVPLLAFEPIDEKLKLIDNEFLQPFTAICFTSANGVNFFLQAFLGAKLNIECLLMKTIYAVGLKTNEKLQEYGLKAKTLPEEYSAVGLLKLLPNDLSKEYFLLPIAEIAKETLVIGLKAKNAKVKVLRTYKTLLLEPQFDLIHDKDWVIFTSPSMVNHYFSYKQLREKSITPFSIGASTTEALRSSHKGIIHTVLESTSEGIVEYLIKHKTSTRSL